MRLPFLGLDATAWIAFAFAGNVACFAGRGILLMVMPQPMPPPVRACGALPHPLLLLSVPVLPLSGWLSLPSALTSALALALDLAWPLEGLPIALTTVYRPFRARLHCQWSRATPCPPLLLSAVICLCLPRLIACGLAVSKWCLGGVVYGVACGVSQTALQGACA